MNNVYKNVPSKTIKAKFSHGVFKPLEEVKITEGEEITITIIKVSLPQTKRKTFKNALKLTAGSWTKLIDAQKLKENIYHDRLIATRREIKL